MHATHDEEDREYTEMNSMQTNMAVYDASSGVAASSSSSSLVAPLSLRSQSGACLPRFSLVSALPIELVSLVGSFLDAHALLVGLAATSSTLRALVHEDRLMWRRMCATRFGVAGQEQEEAESTTQPDWFLQRDSDSSCSSSYTAVADALASSNRWLALYRSFSLTPPRPLRLRVLHADDAGWTGGDYPASNIVQPGRRAFCTQRRRNVHLLLALDDSNAAPSAAAAAAAAVSPAAADAVLPLPPSFLLTDFKVCAAASGYTSPLSAGFLFFTDTLPTPAQIAAWDDWSESQWAAREAALRSDASTTLARERCEGVPRGDDEVPASDAEELGVESWYDDVPRPRSRAPLPDAFPLRFSGPSDEPPFARSSQPLAPLGAFFRLEANGLVLDGQPTPMGNAASDAPPSDVPPSLVATEPRAHSGAISAVPHATVAPVAPVVPTDALASDASWRASQSPFAHRHHLSRPVFGRFLVLTLLRASGDRENIDVAYFGAKGYRRGLHSPPAVHAATDACAANDETLTTQENEALPPDLSPSVDPDAADDGFDFDAASVGGATGTGSDAQDRMRAYLASLHRVGLGMAAEVSALDAHLSRVSAAVAAQQRAQAEAQALRVRILLLQTQQLQLQLRSQHAATRQTLAHAASLNERAARFVAHRREMLVAVEQERDEHRARLASLSEEKEREESRLQTLRQRVADARAREDDLRAQLARNREARDRLVNGTPEPMMIDVETSSGGLAESARAEFQAIAPLAEPIPIRLPTRSHELDYVPTMVSSRAPAAEPFGPFAASSSFARPITHASSTMQFAPVVGITPAPAPASAPTRAPPEPFTPLPSSVVSHASSVSERTDALLARLRAARLQREADAREIYARIATRRATPLPLSSEAAAVPHRHSSLAGQRDDPPDMTREP